MTRDLTKPAPAIALVETRRLKADRIEHGRAAAALPPLLFERLQHFSAESRAAQPLGQKEQIEEEQAERRAADHAADDIAGHRVLDHDGQRTAVADTGDNIVEIVQPAADRALDLGVDHIRDNDVRLLHVATYAAGRTGLASRSSHRWLAAKTGLHRIVDLGPLVHVGRAVLFSQLDMSGVPLLEIVARG